MRTTGKYITLTIAVLYAAMAIRAEASQVVVNFDDLSGAGVLADGYGGINWGGSWSYYDTAQSPYTAHSGTERILPSLIQAMGD